MKLIKHILLNTIFILSLFLVNKSIVKADTLVLTDNDISYNGASRVNFYVNLDSDITIPLQIKFSYTGNIDYRTLVLDVCSGVDLTQSSVLYRTNKVGSGCSTSCFSNNIVRKKLGTTCVNSNGYTTDSYRLYIPIVKLDYGAGCGQTGCHPFMDDKISIHNNVSWWTFADFNGAYLTTEETDFDSVKSTDTINSNINTINNSISTLNTSINTLYGQVQQQTNQQHTDAQNTQNAINNQTNQQHTDSQNTQNAINGVNNSINNDSVDSVDSKANEWSSKNLSDNAISGLLTLPINLITAFNNNINGTCSTFSLGTLFGHELTMPCVNISSYFGTTLWSVIDVLFSGFMILAISKKFVKIFNDFTNLKDTQIDELYGGGA